ncbi:MAG: GAF domain-containing protein [Marmoricola sp.]
MVPNDAPEGDGAANLLDAVVQMSAGLDLGTALDRLVSASCALTDARYGLLGIIDDDGGISDFVLHGMPDEVREQIGHLPTWHGLLGVLLEDPRPMRLDDIAEHPRAIGLPDGHPPMSTFLGMPVLVDGAVFGNLYLTEKAGGEQFTAEDEAAVQTLAQIAGMVIANARVHGISERRHRWLESSIAMTHELQRSNDVIHALGLVATRLCAVAEAAYVVVVEHLDEVPALVTADSGEADVSAADLTGVIEAAAPVLTKASVLGEVMALPYEGATLFVVPLPSRLVPGHSLLAVVTARRLGAGAVDGDVLRAFADQAALALDRTQGLVERQEHMLVADRDRIARDLHDTVIQRVFATALQLQGLRRTVEDDTVRQRLDDAVGELSTTIRDIRSTIFELRHDAGASLKSEIRGLARDYVPVLGFAPFVRIRGPVDATVTPEAADHLIATLRESLSNVARHSDADACVVEVEADRDRLLLRVADNGVGIGTAVSESGLQNIRLRALELGGSFRIDSDEPSGTVIEWQVPLA